MDELSLYPHGAASAAGADERSSPAGLCLPGIRAEITDEALRVQAASVPHELFPAEKLREAAHQTTHLDRNPLLKGSPIRGGFVFWQEDISELQDALDRLRLVQDELRDTGDILKAENAQKARKLKLEEQTRLYDLVEQESAPQFARLEALLSELSNAQSQEEAKPLLGRIAVIMTYIKRRSNLVFLAAQKDFIDANELLLCLNESAQTLGADARTVKFHVSNMLQKTNFENKLQLAVAAIENRLTANFPEE